MRLAMSNIAWDAAEDEAVARVLRAAGFTGVELAPTKWRDDPISAPLADVAALRRAWEDRGLAVVALQALLFGHPELHLFGDARTRRALSDYTKRMIDLAAALGAHALVFGSPKNRVRGTTAMNEALDIAASFFAELGAHAAEHRAVICIEANPPAYGCDFLTTTEDAAALCRRVASDGVQVNVDMGGITMSNEDAAAAVRAAADMIGHVHASEPHLAPLADALVDDEGVREHHALAAATLSAVGYEGWVSVEMRSAPLSSIAAAARFAAAVYG